MSHSPAGPEISRSGGLARTIPQPVQKSHPPAQATTFFPHMDWYHQHTGVRNGGVCQDPEGQYFVWRSLYSLATQERLVSSFNNDGNVKINNLEMGALIMKLLLFSLRMVLLAHIHTYVNNAETHGWANRGSVRTAFFVSPILRDLSFAARR